MSKDNNKKTPKVRFPGFDKDWEERKLGEVCDFINGDRSSNYPSDADFQDSGIPFVGSDSLGATFVNKNKLRFISCEKYKQMKGLKIQDKDILYTLRGAGFGKCSISDFFDGTVASSLVGIRCNEEELEPYFFVQWLNSANAGNEKKKAVNGSTAQNISVDDMKKYMIYLPLQDEQQKVGAYFRNLDHLITLHQRKLEKLKEYKKGMLQKMFPKNGEKIPEVRFPGFTDDWEQRKLGDVIEKLTGGASIAPDDYVDVGYRTIPKGAVNSSGVADMSGCKNVSENFFKKNISSKTSSGELVTSLRDLVPTAPNMGRIVRICGEIEDFLMPQGVYSIIVKEKISEDFLITYSNSPEYRKIIMAEKNGSTQVHIRNGEFLNIDIPLPSYEEQMKIGEHFKTLDHLIALHQRKLEMLKEFKKGCLQQMFV